MEVGKEVALVNGVPQVVDKLLRQVCKDCKVEKEIESFYVARTTKTGYQVVCKECSKKRSKDIRAGTRKAGSRVEEITNERQKKMAHMLIENPRTSLKELSEATGLAISTVGTYLTHGKVLRALRNIGAKEVTRMIPESLSVYRDILNQRDDLGEANKVATKILESEKILGPNRVGIEVTEMREHSSEQLRQMIKEANQFPDQVIQEAEVVE